jgi:hypothetical protein
MGRSPGKALGGHRGVPRRRETTEEDTRHGKAWYKSSVAYVLKTHGRLLTGLTS